MIFAKEATERGINAAIKNNSIGLRAGFGVAAGIATGSPIGALIAAGLGKAVNEYGDQIAASAFTKLSTLTKLRQNVARVDSQMAQGIQKLFGKSLPRSAVSDLTDFMSGAKASVKTAEKAAEDAVIKAASVKAEAAEAVAMNAPDAAAKVQAAAKAESVAAEAVKTVETLKQQTQAPESVSRLEFKTAPIRSAATYAAVNGTSRESYDKSANQIRSAAARPGALSEQIAGSLSEYAEHAPRATAAAAATAVRGVQFLASKLPPPTADPTSLTPQLSKPNRMVSDVAIAKWMRYRDAVNDPIGVLEQARSGKITAEAVEAVKVVYPKLYDQLCETVIRATVDVKHPVSYQESIRIGILLGRPTNWSMTPKAQKTLQGTFSPPQTGPGAVPSGGPKIDIADSTMTSTDKAAYR